MALPFQISLWIHISTLHSYLSEIEKLGFIRQNTN